MTTFDYKKFAAAIADFRKSKGLTLRSAAEQAKVSHTTITRCEGQVTKTDIDNVLSICDWIGIPIENFIKKPKSKSK